MNYTQKAHNLLMKNDDPMGSASSGMKMIDPQTGQQLSHEEWNQRVHEQNPKKGAELEMDTISIDGGYGLPSVQVESDPLTAVSTQMEPSRGPSSRMDKESLALLADLAAAGLPTLSGFAAGASPQVMKSHLARQHKYTDTRGKQLVPSKENLMELEGEDGQPIYDLAINALGRKPYYAPKGGAGAGGQGGGVQSLKNIYNSKDGTSGILVQYRDGTREIIDDLQPFGGYGTFTAETPTGGKYQKQYVRNDPRFTGGTTYHQEGYGDIANRNISGKGTPKESIKLIDKQIESYRKDTQDFVTKRADLEGRLANALTQDPTKFDLAGFNNALLFGNTIETRLTDQDAARALGEEFRTYARQFQSFMQRKFAGGLSKRELGQMELAAKRMIDVMGKTEQAIRDEYSSTLRGVVGSEDYLKTRGFGEKSTYTKKAEEVLKAKRKKVESYMERAKKTFPNDENRQRKYAEFLANEEK